MGKKELSQFIMMVDSEFQDEILLSEGGCGTPSRNHLVRRGKMVILHACMLLLSDLLILQVFILFYIVKIYFRINFD
jgi:hypothetical protein